MYRVYGYDKGWQMLDVTSEESDVLDAISYYVSNHKYINCVVIKHENDMDVPYVAIQSENDFINYYQNYKSREKVLTKGRHL